MNAPVSSLTAQPDDERALAARLFDDIAALSPDRCGVSRPAFSEVETKVLAYLEDFARSEGLHVWYDAGRNANFCLPGDRAAATHVVVGSHVDSVPQGGNFDGLAGVICGLLCLVRARRGGFSFPRPVRVLALRGEESPWFGPCYIGSKILTGALGPKELASRHKGDGRPLSDHLADLGLPVARIAKGEPLADSAAMEAFIELHIEQGPLLIGKKLPAAIVRGIRGNFRHRHVRCLGEQGHSGAVPRAFRRDPVLAVADLLARLDESWSSVLNKGDDLVLTCGMIGTDPLHHAMTRIADEIDFSLDIRSQDESSLDEMRDQLRQQIGEVERERKVRFELDAEMAVAPAHCDPDLVTALCDAAERAGQTPFVMASGGGHDAAVFAEAGVPVAMIFVRNRNGSHNPDEAMELADFLAATDIVATYLAGIGSGDGT